MKISVSKMQLLKRTPNSAYTIIAPEVLYHSNRIEGSTFTLPEVETLYASGKVVGDHDYDDIVETRNSLKVLDLMIETLGDPITADLLIELEATLHAGTTTEERGESGHFKYIPNRIRNSSVQVALPSDIPTAIPELIETWEASGKGFEDICRFHTRFEHLHPFQDGNGRIGRIVMLKQCIEQGVDLIVVSEDLADTYRAWMEIAQTTGDHRFFLDAMRKCQEAFDRRMEEVGATRLVEATPEHAPARPPLDALEAECSPNPPLGASGDRRGGESR